MYLARYLEEKGVLKSPLLISAFEEVDRADFVPAKLYDFAYEDHPLDIGWGQTISQPYTVSFMLELLSLEEGNIVMDVGYGSGWTTALISHAVGDRGKVYAIERVPELCDFGKKEH